jgi:DNA-binding NarL/FixJ family response regulator
MRDINAAILAVDDDILVLNSLRIQLERNFNDHILEFAQNVDEAIGVIDDLRSQDIKLIIIISDWVMPLKNGDELAKYVKNIDSSVKVVVLSGKLEEIKVQAYIENNTIDRVVMKPWDEAYLMEVIKNEIA